MKYKLKFLFLVCLNIGFLVPLVNAQASAIDLFGNPCSKDTAANSSVCAASGKAQSDTSHNNAVLRIINAAANVVAAVAGLAAVLMIIIAGFSYTTAGGNAEQTKSARNRIIYSAVGLVIVAMAWTITRFILDKVL